MIAIDDLNPFIFNRPVDREDLIDRELEVEQLLGLAEGGHATRLSAPRRYGKTSLLHRVGYEAERIGLSYVEVDFYGVLSHSDVAARMEAAYMQLRSPLRRIAIASIAALRPRVSVGAGPVRLEAQTSGEKQPASLIAGLLDLPLALYRRRGTRTLIAFDEFQALLAVDPQIDGLFRSHIQRHGDAASYIFAGSHPGLMEQLFGSSERPFFGQARALHLDPLSDPDLADYIGERFERGGRDASPTLPALLALAEGHPQRGMLLAHHLWEQTPRGEAATPERWQLAVESVFAEHGEALQAIWDGVNTQERRVLAAFALSDESLFNRRTLARFNLSKSSAQHARDKLLHAGHLRSVGDDVQVVDPLLRRWIEGLGPARLPWDSA